MCWRLLLFAAVLAATTPPTATAAANDANNPTLAIPCDELYHALAAVTRLRTGSLRHDQPADCSMQLVQLFYNFMLRDEAQGPLLPPAGTPGSAGTANTSHLGADHLVLALPYLEQARVRQWLVWAFLGKHFVAQETERQTAFFEYDEVSGVRTVNGTLTRVLAACEFQQPLYLTLIVVLIVMLVAILVWPVFEKMRCERERAAEQDPWMTAAVCRPEAPIKTSLRFRIPGPGEE